MRIGGIAGHLMAGIAAVLLGACASGGDGGAVHRSSNVSGAPPVPTKAMADRSGESLDVIGRGYWIFQRKCLECHEAKFPHDRSEAGWHAIVGGMAWNAGLSKSEERPLLAYTDAVKD